MVTGLSIPLSAVYGFLSNRILNSYGALFVRRIFLLIFLEEDRILVVSVGNFLDIQADLTQLLGTPRSLKNLF